jgi:hypothetical protein
MVLMAAPLIDAQPTDMTRKVAYSCHGAVMTVSKRSPPQAAGL